MSTREVIGALPISVPFHPQGSPPAGERCEKTENAVSGLLHGRLPIEISTRGARFAEEADQSAGFNEAAIENLKQTAGAFSDDLIKVGTEIDELKRQVTLRDGQ